jgi:hypothetical protein
VPSVRLDIGERPQANVHPVVWLFAQAPSELTNIESEDAETLLHSPSAVCRKWVECTPDLDRWFNSERFATAPERWPSIIIDSFGVPYVPSPWEVANAIPANRRDPLTRSDGAKLLVCYACGVPTSTMASVMRVTDTHVMDVMRSAAADWGCSPRFTVWASNVDFNKVGLALTLPGSLIERVEAQASLVHNPLTASEGDLAFLTASPLFVAAVRTGTLPSRKGYRQIREPGLVRPPRA